MSALWPVGPLVVALEDERARRGMSWEALAAECGVTDRAFRHVRSQRWVSTRVADRVLTGLGLSEWEVFGDCEPVTRAEVGWIGGGGRRRVTEAVA